MKSILYAFIALITVQCFAQDKKVDLSNFELSNISSPAFILLEESPSEIYVPKNLKKTVLHIAENLGENLSLEVTPYFFIKQENRTYYKYIGVSEENGEKKQNIFSGILNNMSISLGYSDKEFSGLNEKMKALSFGLRTTLIRVYNKTKILDNAQNIAEILTTLDRPVDLFKKRAKAEAENNTEEFKKYDELIKLYYEAQEKVLLKPFYKTIKPILTVDGAIAYSSFIDKNDDITGSANRFGSWIVSETSFPLNLNIKDSDNNYINFFVLGRYIEDSFNLNSSGHYNKQFYRDIGGKVELEIWRLALSYEFISRNGSVNTERSIGNLKFSISKDVSITGGFGKDFNTDSSTVTLLGINWGINFGNNSASL